MAYKKDFKKAEKIYVQNGDFARAVQMYQDTQQWEEGLRVSQENQPQDFQQIKSQYVKWLIETEQYLKAGKTLSLDRDHQKAAEIYLKGGFPVLAMKIAIDQNWGEGNALVG